MLTGTAQPTYLTCVQLSLQGMDDLSRVSLAAVKSCTTFVDDFSVCLQLHADAQEAKEEAAMLQQVAAAAASARERENELRKTLAEKEQ